MRRVSSVYRSRSVKYGSTIPALIQDSCAKKNKYPKGGVIQKTHAPRLHHRMRGWVLVYGVHHRRGAAVQGAQGGEGWALYAFAGGTARSTYRKLRGQVIGTQARSADQGLAATGEAAFGTVGSSLDEACMRPASRRAP